MVDVHASASKMRSPLIAGTKIDACSAALPSPAATSSADLVTVQSDRVRLVVQPRPAHLRGQ